MEHLIIHLFLLPRETVNEFPVGLGTGRRDEAVGDLKTFESFQSSGFLILHSHRDPVPSQRHGFAKTCRKETYQVSVATTSASWRASSGELVSVTIPSVSAFVLRIINSIPVGLRRHQHMRPYDLLYLVIPFGTSNGKLHAQPRQCHE